MSEETADQVAIHAITQATTATFTDLYLRLAFLFFIESGSKRVATPTQERLGEEGDLLVFPAGGMVTMENRPVFSISYRAVGISFPDAVVRQVFGNAPAKSGPAEVQILRAEPDHPMVLPPIIRDTLERAASPDAVRRHRLLEPLIWLRDKGVRIAAAEQEAPLSRLRRLIETDLTHDWRAADVARELSMSEATMRRWLGASGQSFSKILSHTRLEHGLSLLQTTRASISEIALECGFKTPSHFSDAFRKRFGIAPKQIRAQAD